MLQVARPGDEVLRYPCSAALLAARVQRLSNDAAASRSPDHDVLTGLLSRRGMEPQARQWLNCQTPDDACALVLIDLDHFKRLNDEHGHAAGDDVLRGVAASLQRGLSPDDIVARWGGEEFVALMSRYDAATLVKDAEKLLSHIATPVQSSTAGELVVTGSAGLVLLHPGSRTAWQGALHQADQALYEAKSRGRNQLVHFELVHEGRPGDAEAELQRFSEVTRMFSDRLNRMVGHMGRRLVEGARRHALIDALTGAHNRGYFNERLPRELERAQAGSRPLCMALLDIDDFHEVNLRFGWPSGDKVLQTFVGVVEAHIRRVDWLARYGGEEFAIVLPDTDADAAREVLERVRRAVQATEFHALDGRTVPVTISIGGAVLQAGVADMVGFTDLASNACLLAKSLGKNRVWMSEDPPSAART